MNAWPGFARECDIASSGHNFPIGAITVEEQGLADDPKIGVPPEIENIPVQYEAIRPRQLMQTRRKHPNAVRTPGKQVQIRYDDTAIYHATLPFMDRTLLF